MSDSKINTVGIGDRERLTAKYSIGEDGLPNYGPNFGGYRELGSRIIDCVLYSQDFHHTCEEFLRCCQKEMDNPSQPLDEKIQKWTLAQRFSLLEDLSSDAGRLIDALVLWDSDCDEHEIICNGLLYPFDEKGELKGATPENEISRGMSLTASAAKDSRWPFLDSSRNVYSKLQKLSDGFSDFSNTIIDNSDRTVYLFPVRTVFEKYLTSSGKFERLIIEAKSKWQSILYKEENDKRRYDLTKARRIREMGVQEVRIDREDEIITTANAILAKRTKPIKFGSVDGGLAFEIRKRLLFLKDSDGVVDSVYSHRTILEILSKRRSELFPGMLKLPPRK